MRPPPPGDRARDARGPRPLPADASRLCRKPALAGALLGAALLLAVASCATSRFDRLYESGDFERAVELYEADLDLQGRERAIYRAALMRARPGGEAYDPDRARRDFRRLLDLFPETDHRESATAQLALLDEVIRLRRESEERAAGIARLEREVEALRERAGHLEEKLAEREDRLDLLRVLVDALRADLRERERRLVALERELERLKAIDLGPP